MLRVQVKPALLTWALNQSGDPARIKGKFPKLPDWIKGQVFPTLRQLEEFARATRIPFGYFFLEEPPQEEIPVPLYRTYGDKGPCRVSRDLLEVVWSLQRRQQWMREYLKDNKYERLNFVGCASISDNPEKVAEKIRQILEIDEVWATSQLNWSQALESLIVKVEKIGIVVVISSIVDNNTHRKLDPEDFRGFVLIDDYAPFVFINAADAKAAQMFTLSHELAHIWVGSNAAFDLRDVKPADNEVEQFCNKVAAEFLVPSTKLKEIWGKIAHTENPFQEIARYFKVSEIVAARRALDLKLIRKEIFFKFYRDYIEKIARKKVTEKGGGNFYNLQMRRLGRPFLNVVFSAVRQGYLLYHEAYRLTGLYAKTFDEMAKLLHVPQEFRRT